MGTLGDLVTWNPVRSIGDNLDLRLASEVTAVLYN